MNYSELNNPEMNKDIFNNQGMDYIKFRNKKKEIDGKLLSTTVVDNNSVNGIIEGFSSMYPGNAVDAKNSSDFNAVVKLQEEYQKKLSEYSSAHRDLLSKISEYFKIKESKLINTNIQLPSGHIGYVTSDGVFKHYPNRNLYNQTRGKNGCPSNYTRANGKIVGNIITSNDSTFPNFKLGTPMEMGQSCGDEGKNVFVTNPGPVGNSKYEGCYNNSTSSELTKSSETGQYNAVGFNKCKQFAHDTGNSVFAISKNGDGTMNCYVGDDLNKVKEGGVAIVPIQSWASSQVNGTVATFNAAGQLLIQGTSTSQSNIVNGLQCKVYNGYMGNMVNGKMVDNVNYFKTANSITSVPIVNFTNISKATNNSFPTTAPASVEWIGYIKANSSGNWSFNIKSDDCSYMWIGSPAVSEYNIGNAFINNGGIHATRLISRSVSLTTGQYYPIRIQFGQNRGAYSFELKVKRPDGSTTYDTTGIFFSTPDTFNMPLYPETGDTLTTLWKSNEPRNGCDPTYGGKINLTESVSTWGYNCNARNTDAWGKPASYSVPLGNMNEAVFNDINGKVNGTTIVGKDMIDPAYGCGKNFSSTYRCGNGTVKSIYMSGEASGRNATYDCNIENGLCSFTLKLQDNGNLVIYGKDYNASTKQYSDKVIWSTRTHTKIDVVDESRKASKGKNGRSYLLPGETLKDGEFIGSNNGKCFLTMTKGIGLQLFYNKKNCSSNDYITYPNSNTPSTETLAVYTLPTAKGFDSIGKVSYINSDGQLSDYPQDMIEKGDTYFDLGNFNNPGNDIKSIQTTSLETCKNECNSANECDGFVFGNNTCYLKNSNMYPKSNRFENPSVKLYKRSVNVKNNNSCSKNVSNIGSDRWDSYIKTDEMTENELCGLGKHVNQSKENVNKIIESLNNVANQIYQKMSSLSEDDKKLLNEYGINEKKINDDLLKIKSLEKDYSDSKGKIGNIYGMKDNSENELLHNNYKYMLWSILAVILVIGGMKILKR